MSWGCTGEVSGLWSQWDWKIGTQAHLQESPLPSSRLSYPTACGILVIQPGIRPASLELEGVFLTTEPPGKSPDSWFESWLFYKTSSVKIRIILTLHECAWSAWWCSNCFTCVVTSSLNPFFFFFNCWKPHLWYWPLNMLLLQSSLFRKWLLHPSTYSNQNLWCYP